MIMNDDQAPTIDDLQGEWRIVSVGEDGGKAPFFIPWLFKLRLRVEGKRYTKYMGKKVVETGRLRIKPKSGYSTMDERIESGDDCGKLHLGIIQWVGKRLEHLQGKVDDERPKQFPYRKDSQVGYAMMKRTQ